MMMSALQVGGMPLLIDGVRAADDNNPKGYYEYERVKKLPGGDTKWLASANGKAVKVISTLLEYLPDNYHYRVIFMERDIDEILASQKRMLDRDGIIEEKPVSDQEMRESYLLHLAEVKSFLQKSPWLQRMTISYNEILREPEEKFNQVAKFLDGTVDPDGMIGIVDRSLYRERK